LSRKWSRERIINEILKIYKSGEPLNPSFMQKNNTSLIVTASSRRYFGSWKIAIESAGLDYDKIKIRDFTVQKWSKNKIIMEIQKLAENGKDLNLTSVGKNYKQLYSAARKPKYFGSWDKALIASGINPSEVRIYCKWNRKKIIEEIIKLRDNGVDLCSSNIHNINNPLLMAAQKSNYFGSWENALKAAGINPNDYRKHKDWSKTKIIIKILELNRLGEDLNANNLLKKYPDLLSAATSKRYFKSWEEAICAAGLDYSEIKIRDFTEKKWSKEIIIEEILKISKFEKDLSPKNFKEKHQRLYGSAVSQRYFGSWYNALYAAGFDLRKDKIRKKIGITLPIKWSKGKIVEKILEIAENNEPLNQKYIKENYSKLLAAATQKRHFGNWKSALEAAGFTYEKIRITKEWSKDKIIREIKKLDENGEMLYASYIHKNYQNLLSAGNNHFGSWKNAIEATGFNYEEIKIRDFSTKKYSKEIIIDRILEIFNNGGDLTYIHSNKEIVNLAAASKRYFGSWREAIEEAGLDCNEIFSLERWDRGKVIETIKEMHDDGEDLSARYNLMNRGGLYRAGSRTYFNSWGEAIETAGFNYDEIKLDSNLEPFKGNLFEKYVEEIFKLLGVKTIRKPRYQFENDICIPDFVFKNDDLWADAKLRSWSSGIEDTIYKYLKYTNKLLIIYLLGNKRKWRNNNVIFKCVKDYYFKLRNLGREDIIQDLTLLEKGIVLNKNQKKLLDYE